MFTNKKIATVSVINDLVTDNRVKKICFTLVECDYDVTLIGRKLPSSLEIPNWPYKTKRLNLLFKKGPLFYLFFNLRLFFNLLFKKTDLLYSNDLDTLLPNYLVSRIKKTPLIYDSHELFCEVPELKNSPLKRKVWLALEAWIIPKLKHCITVNQSIATIFNEKYGSNFQVVRNIAEAPSNPSIKTKTDLNLPLTKKIILLQGAGINIDRGAEELVESMTQVNNALLLIIGSGDIWPVLKSTVMKKGLSEKVWLIDKLPKSELIHYTNNADIGLSIDKNTNLNYYYSLPNKLFDYINAGLPVLASRLPEIERIVKTYNIGTFIENHDPSHIAEKLNELLCSLQLSEYRKNMQKAKEELTWEKEKIILKTVIQGAQQN